MNWRTVLYRGLSLSNDVRAVRRGPAAVVRRAGRKVAYRTTTRLLRRVGL